MAQALSKNSSLDPYSDNGIAIGKTRLWMSKLRKRVPHCVYTFVLQDNMLILCLPNGYGLSNQSVMLYRHTALSL